LTAIDCAVTTKVLSVRPYILAGELQTRQVAHSILCSSHTAFNLSYIIRGDDIKENDLLKKRRENLRPTEF